MNEIAASAWKKFLSRPVPQDGKDPIVQLYDDADFLAEAVARYAIAGLRLGEGVVLIATKEHLAGIRLAIRRENFFVDGYLESGQLVLLDAEATLEKITHLGLPEWKRFQVLVGQTLQSLRLQFKHVRAFGEMVDILRQRKSYHGMHQLEAYWNTLAEVQSFSLLSGQFISGSSEEEQTRATANISTIGDLERKAGALEREVEERKRVEAALRESQASLSKAVEARDHFLSIAAHELKTPLTSLSLNAQLLQRRARDSSLDAAAMDRYLEANARQVARLSQLVENILQVSRISVGNVRIEPAPMNLAECARSALDKFATQFASHGCTPMLEVKGSVNGQWDRRQLEQVLDNLLSNVAKYAPGRPVHVSVSSENGKAQLRVQDQGEGISGPDLERIFERFERAGISGDNSGLGLGLYISREIVTAHHGKIWAESAPGQGATFVVELPL